MKYDEIGKYYVCLKKAHIEWKRKTGPRGDHGEAYLPIPSKFAYLYDIKKGDVFQCLDEDNKETCFELKSEGTQVRRDYAKQFAGNRNLKILYDWYASKGASEGDYVVVTIFSNNRMYIRYVGQEQKELRLSLGLEGSSGRPISDEYEIADVHGFKLISLQVKDGDNTICDMSFLRDGIEKNTMNPITTLIIGANGAGKSSALKYITEIINACIDKSHSKSLQYSFYCLRYYYEKNIIEIIIRNKTILFLKNGKMIEEKEKYRLPKKVLAIAFMLNDKFVYRGQKTEGPYEYLGIKVSSNAAWITSISNKVAENIIDLTINNKMNRLFDSLSEYLQLDKKFAIAFEFAKSKKEYAQLSLDKIVEIIECEVLLARGSRDFRRDVANRITEDDIIEYALYVHEKAMESEPTLLNGMQLGIMYEGKAYENNKTLSNQYKIIRVLSNLGIIKNITLVLYKRGREYSFEESSSGEKHVIYIATSIARYICDNSLILIDEPEVSLHPNWQMRYVSFLRKIFSDYPTCHFVIASHSPYLVSDLAPESSSLIALNIEEGKKIAKTIEYDTYAWSAENVLYNVFGVRTTRNYYFNADLQELLTLINQKEKLNRVKELYTKLSGYYFNEEDPLHLILNNVKEYIDNAESNDTIGIVRKTKKNN